MKKNVKVAKELVKIAKDLLGANKSEYEFLTEKDLQLAFHGNYQTLLDTIKQFLDLRLALDARAADAHKKLEKFIEDKKNLHYNVGQLMAFKKTIQADPEMHPYFWFMSTSSDLVQYDNENGTDFAQQYAELDELATPTHIYELESGILPELQVVQTAIQLVDLEKEFTVRKLYGATLGYLGMDRAMFDKLVKDPVVPEGKSLVESFYELLDSFGMQYVTRMSKQSEYSNLAKLLQNQYINISEQGKRPEIRIKALCQLLAVSDTDAKKIDKYLVQNGFTTGKGSNEQLAKALEDAVGQLGIQREQVKTNDEMDPEEKQALINELNSKIERGVSLISSINKKIDKAQRNIISAITLVDEEESLMNKVVTYLSSMNAKLIPVVQAVRGIKGEDTNIPKPIGRKGSVKEAGLSDLTEKAKGFFQKVGNFFKNTLTKIGSLFSQLTEKSNATTASLQEMNNTLAELNEAFNVVEK